MTTTEQLSPARRLALAGFSRGDLDALAPIVAAEYVNHQNPPGFASGRAGLAQVIGMVRTAFPDFAYAIEHELVGDDHVLLHVTASGTHDGPLFGGVPATGRRATWQEMHLFRCADGVLAEHWGVRDDLGMLRQLGLAPG